MTDAIIPVGHKPIVERTAVATGVLELSPDSADAIRNGLVAKGDVLEASMVAAIQAVKIHLAQSPTATLSPSNHVQSFGIGKETTCAVRYV